ncbi:RidA family protein [Rhodobacteraceae bacterium D3-12]|nr:RidA family protein [Rhodobacteraceae bacterium D3-12]
MTTSKIVQPSQFGWAKPSMTVAEWNGDLLYISGLVAFQHDGSIAPGGMYDQAVCVFSNLKTVLAEAGLEMDSLLKINCFLADPSKFGEFATARAEAFPVRLPVNTTVGSTLVMPELLVEVDAIARR